MERIMNMNYNNATTQQCNGKAEHHSSVTAVIPRPEIAFTDEEVARLPLRPMKQVVRFMYQRRPILEKILKNGDAVADEFWKAYGRNDKNYTPTELDLAVTSKVVFWLYRYGKNAIVGIMMKSKLNHSTADYWQITVQKALDGAIEYFPATVYNLKKEEKGKLDAWIAWKKQIANQERSVGK